MKDERVMRREQSAALITSDQLEGTPVYDAQGHLLGKVDDLMVDAAKGDVRFVLLAPPNSADDDRLSPLPWELLRFDDQRNGYIASISRDELIQGPSVQRQDVVDWTDESWGSRLHSHYRAPDEGS